ncbi:hypothetical protein ACLOJK_030540 [Asimina triloba]
MKAILLRTASGSGRSQLSVSIGSPRSHSHGGLDHAVGISFSSRSSTPSPRYSLHCKLRDSSWNATGFRRALSESDLIRSEIATSDQSPALGRLRSRSIPSRIAEEENLSDESDSAVHDDDGSLMLKWKSFDVGISDRVSAFSEEESEFSGGGSGNGRKAGRGGDSEGEFTGGNADRSEVGEYYQKMLKMDPGNPLLLRNYAKFLHEVEKDLRRAEEYYGRAILASPGDAEVLSLYGKLIWEAERDKQRAQTYFVRAIEAASDDSFVLGSYAHFLWDAAEDEEEDVAQEAAGGLTVGEMPSTCIRAC